jgi:TfoX/Sxy family transcriptional regulator of competence genes
MGYYELPADVLEDPDALRQWADQAVAVAARRKRGRPRRTRRDPD